MLSSIDPVSDFGNPMPWFDYPWFRDMCVKYKIPGFRFWPYDSWMPGYPDNDYEEVKHRCYVSKKVGTKVKWDTTKLNPSWAANVKTGINEMAELGISPIVSLKEYRGMGKAYNMFANSPYNKANSLTGKGATDPIDLMCNEKWVDEFFKPLFVMIRDLVKPVNRSKVIWETGNEPTLKASQSGVEAYMAKFIVSQGISKDRVCSCIHAGTVQCFLDQRDWRRNCDWGNVHGSEDWPTADANMQAVLRIAPGDDFIPNSDGGGPVYSLPPSDIQKVCKKYNYYGILWAQWDGFKFETGSADWVKFKKLAEPRFAALGKYTKR